MATAKSQRIIIWVIAIVMAVGTLGAYFVLILANQNGEVKSNEQLAYEKQLEQYQKQQAACPVGEVADKKITPAPTPPEVGVVGSIKELKTEDVTVGTGQEIKAGDCIELLYHGVLASNGKAFAGGDNYASGIPYRSLTTGFVPGFASGLVGMKVGGERKIFIPSAQAYGKQAQGEIPADADLVFVVKVVGTYTQQ